MEQPSSSPAWAIVELMGHRILVGRVSEVVIAGAALIRIEVFVGDAAVPVASPMHPPSALYGITPCTEEHARRVAGGRLFGIPTLPAIEGPAVAVEPDGDGLAPKEWAALEVAADVLLNEGAPMDERHTAAKGLANTFGITWPRTADGDVDDDPDVPF